MIIIKMNSLLPFLLLLIPVVHCVCVRDQQLLLLTFKKSLVYNVSLSSKLSSWNSSADCCSWLGITCSTNGRVIGLDISSQSISDGVDNSSTLFHLQYLQSLNLADNPQLGNLSHSIPSAIGQLSRLRYLNLSLNYYSGQIPIQISHLTRLKVLDFSYTDLELKNSNLHKLVQNLTELRELYLDNVQILARGSVWCEAISSSLPNLRVLSLFYCGLSGPFHSSLTKLQSLSVIHLGGNNISAPVPEFFAKFSNLTSLSLYSCNLKGTFPKEIFQIPSLQSIDISINEELDGSLPEFPNNGSLQNLVIGQTNFSGSLPGSIGNLTQLTSLMLSMNSFEGSLPSFNRATNLENLVLSYNGLTGNISGTQWENLTKLEYFSLFGNKVTGNIPLSLFSHPSLYSLNLGENQFSGQLPETHNLSSSIMRSLDLGFNNLEGPILKSIFNLRSLVELDLSSNNFSGSFPLNDLRYLKNLTEFRISNNSLSLTHDATNFSYSDFPQLHGLHLACLSTESTFSILSFGFPTI